MSSNVSLSVKEINELESLMKKIKKKRVEYKSPLSSMPARAAPGPENTIQVKGSCPSPLKSCDAVSAQKAGKTCPDPRLAVYPYIQVEETGALCYPNLNTAAMQREMREEKKALARKSILDLIKVLAAIEDGDATPDMCNVVNQMTSKPQELRQAYCKSLKHGEVSMCKFDNDNCLATGAQVPSQPSQTFAAAAPAPVPGRTQAAGVPVREKSVSLTGSRAEHRMFGKTYNLTPQQLNIVNQTQISSRAKLFRNQAVTDTKIAPKWREIVDNVQNGKIETEQQFVTAVEAATNEYYNSTSNANAPTGQAESSSRSETSTSKGNQLLTENQLKIMPLSQQALANMPF
jgi:hypothetical protein